ncbi:MAG: chromate transporter [Oscillospiraceae bacterium]|nr:chromate transporter [Oscillospiraceae bacterium]
MLQTLILLAYEFFFTGLFAVGGGLATIPFLQSMGARRPAWFSAAQLADMIAAAQCAPGPLGTNMATYVGYTVGGFPGAALSPLSLMIPTIVVDLFAARLMERFRDSARWERVMRVLRPASAGLICAAALALLQISLASGTAWNWNAPLAWFDWRCVALYGALLPFVAWKKLRKIHPAVYIAVGAVVGVVWGL